VVFQVKKGLLVRKEIRENLIHLVILASQVNKEILGLQDHLENKDEKEQLDSQVQKVLQG
jgi:ribosomal protein L7Ae-like RNA K-turn-binding protein